MHMHCAPLLVLTRPALVLCTPSNTPHAGPHPAASEVPISHVPNSQLTCTCLLGSRTRYTLLSAVDASHLQTTNHTHAAAQQVSTPNCLAPQCTPPRNLLQGQH